MPETTVPSQSDQPSRGFTSRLPGFYELPLSQRSQLTAELTRLTPEDAAALGSFGALSPELTEVFIENAVGTWAMPLGIATNFRINGTDVLVPMAVEETSVLAAASHGAKLARAGGGFSCSASAPIMTGQVQMFVDGLDDARRREQYDATLRRHREDLLAFANRGQERLIERGGGAKDLEWFFRPRLEAVVLHLHVDTRDAMGANIVNTLCEKLSTVLSDILPGARTGLRILTNLCDRRTATARCRVPAQALHSDRQGLDGASVVERIVRAYEFAADDPYRCATHNKGVMNGIDAVVIATGNDWRAVEAGAHAFAARDGRYRPMTHWHRTATGDLEGSIELPMALGTVGGVTKLHPTARAALRLMNSPSATQLAEIVCSVGLAQNLSALRALASEGIQRGHMSLHQQNLDVLQRQGASRG